jgi:predicted nucleic acid-binding protein
MRKGRNPVRLLASWIQSGEIVSCGVVRIEVLRGMVKPAAKAEITGLFDAIPEIPLQSSVVADAADLAWTLDRKGTVLPVTDLLIAACARKAGALVVSEDPHFAAIPGLRVASDLPSTIR